MPQTREEKIAEFNPNENGLRDHGIFGLPFSVEESLMVLLPVPWEATVSYSSGTAKGPKAILDASQQIDLYDPISPDFWKQGIAMVDIPSDIYYQSMQVRKKSVKYLVEYLKGEIDLKLQNKIKEECELLNDYVEKQATELLDKNKIVGLVGGEHSVILGFIKALAKKHESFSILHIDAHADLRKSYEGLEYSHASTFYNVLEVPNVKKLVQVGIRDFCEEENNFTKNNSDRVKMFTDYEIKKALWSGSSWSNECDKIIAELGEEVYISFDIDGLVPNLCPHTGTPVPGGFEIDEMVFLFEKMIDAGKKIIGFDLCEVAPGKDESGREDEWDGNVGARVLYKLCLLSGKSNKE